MYAYEFLDERFVGGIAESWTVPPLACQLPGSDFESLGFDAVSKSVTDFFEHSPLSCNGAAKTFRANSHCLFDALEDAVAAAEVFSKEEPEPGSVLRCPGLPAAPCAGGMKFAWSRRQRRGRA